MSVNTLLLYFVFVLTLCLPLIAEQRQLTSDLAIEIIKNLVTLKPPYLMIGMNSSITGHGTRMRILEVRN